jgi:hypothetical protein
MQLAMTLVAFDSRTPWVSAVVLALLSACGGAGEAPETSAAMSAMPRPTKVVVVPNVAAPMATKERAAPPFEPLALVPEDTIAVVRIASLEEMENALLEVGAIAERTGTPAPLRERLMLFSAQAGIEWSALRSDEPIVIAVRLPARASQPAIVVYAPVSTAKREAGMPTNQVEVDGDYLAITLPGVATPPAAPPKWCEELGGGLLRARIDVRALMRRIGAMVPHALAKALPSEGLSPEQASELRRQQQELLALAASARELDLSIDFVEGRLSVATDLEVDGGPVAAHVSQRGNVLGALSRHLAADVPIAGAISFDVENAAQAGTEQFTATIASLPEPMRTALGPMHGAAVEFLRSFEPGAVVMLDPTPGAMHLALVMQARDPNAARDALGTLLAACDLDALGFDLSLPARSRLGNAVVETFTFRFDTRRLDFDTRSAMRTGFESFLGSPNLSLFVGTTGRETIFVLGGDTSATQAKLRAFSTPAGAPQELVTGLEALGRANPAAVWRIDAGRLATLGVEFEAAVTGGSAAAARREALRSAPGLGSVPLVLWGGARADRAFGGLEVDLDDLERALEVLRSR